MKALKKEFVYHYINIPYLEYNEKINGNLFRRNFVIDIRNFNQAELKSLFENYDDFQFYFFQDKFWNNADSRFNMVIYFIYDENVKSSLDLKKVTNNFEYAIKKFVTEKELETTCFNDDINLGSNDIIASCNGISITNRFNLINGKNGSGKTVLLNDIANKLNAQVFNLSSDSIECDFVYKKLLKYFKINEDYLTGSQKNLYNLCKVLTFCARNEQPILLDDLQWNSLDSYNQIKLIDLLSDFSITNDVVVTSCKEDVKTLVKRRTYEPNIIDLK